MKHYDEQYFDSWYRNPGSGIGSPAVLRRKVALAIAQAEAVLDRSVRSVLDVGCGEGRWQPQVRRIRPKATYLGVDPSEYAVKRFGARRNLRLGTFEDFGDHVPERTFDLVVCSDVLHYLKRGQIVRGLEALVPRVGGVALLEAFTTSDDIIGDAVDFRRRTAQSYRDIFWEAGLVPIGMQAYVRWEKVPDLDALDVCR